MSNRIDPRLFIMIYLPIFLITICILIYLFYLPFGSSPEGKVVEACLLSLLIIPNVIYFSTHAVNQNLRRSLLIISMILCFIPTFIDGRLRLFIVLLAIVIANAGIFLFKDITNRG